MEPSRLRVVLLVVTTAEFLSTFTVSSVNIALKAIDKEWGGTSGVILSWVSLAYMLALAAFLMPAGRLADLYGRRRFFLAGMVVFSVLAFGSAFAPSVPMLLGFRAAQGIGAAMLYACTVPIVTLAFPPERRGWALGILVGGVYLGFTLGPLLGGLIIDNIGWRWVFGLIGALGLVNSGLAVWWLRGVEWKEAKRASFDLSGSIAWGAALTMLLIGPSAGCCSPPVC
jgi:MFS family permease